MTSQQIWILGLDFATVFGAGAWLGYRLRGAVERSRRKRETIDLADQWRGAFPKVDAYTKQLAEQMPRDQVTPPDRPRARRPEVIPIDPIVVAGPVARSAALPVQQVGRSRRPTPAPAPIVNPDREDVVAALIGAGYKRSAAAAAADACTLPERAAGVESWIRAALARAVTPRYAESLVAQGRIKIR